MSRREPFRPGVEALESRWQPAVTFHGGALLTHVEAQPVLADIDLADPQPVGIGVLHRLDDLADDERGQRLCRVFDAFDLQPDAGQGG